MKSGPQPSKRKRSIHQRWAPATSSSSRKPAQSSRNGQVKSTKRDAKTMEMPPELIRKILLHIDPIHDKAILARCLRVSKTTFHLAAPLLYRHVVAPGSLSPRLNPLRPLPMGVKWYDPTQPILDKAFQRDTLLLLAEKITSPYAHRHVFQSLFERLASEGKLNTIVRSFQKEKDNPRPSDLPPSLDRKQYSRSLEIPLTPKTVWEGCPALFSSKTLCHIPAWVPHRPLHHSNLVIKMQPAKDFETILTDPDCAVHGLYPVSTDPSLLLCPPHAEVTLIFWTSRPTEAWTQRSLTGDVRYLWDHRPGAPAWGALLSHIAQFVYHRACKLLIVNAGAIDRLSAAENVWDHDAIQTKFKEDVDRVYERRKTAAPQNRFLPGTMAGTVRHLSMREYIDQEDWHGAFTPQEIEPWLRDRHARGAEDGNKHEEELEGRAHGEGSPDAA